MSAGLPAQGDEPTVWSSVHLRKVTKMFGEATVVDGLDLEVREGEFFTLLGPSGCGKTTTLRMIAGFEQPTTGRVLIDNRDMVGVAAHRRPTNTVFQSYALFPHLNVAENVGFGLKRSRIDSGEINRRVATELERVGLAGEANRRPSQLSGGQQQRVALARAIINRPKVLLLDEPLGALDLKLRKGLQLELKRIQREVGITFVYVTHDQEEALTMSDRIAVMDRGQIEQIGSPEDVYERPATTFVAAFIGVSNLIPGTVTSATEDRVSVRLENGVEVPIRKPDLMEGERCQIVVRPEKLRIEHSRANGETGPPAPTNWPSTSGIVESSVYLGTSTQIVVSLGEQVRMTVLVPNADEAERDRLPGGGAEVRLSWHPNHMHLLPDHASSEPVDDKQDGNFGDVIETSGSIQRRETR